LRPISLKSIYSFIFSPLFTRKNNIIGKYNGFPRRGSGEWDQGRLMCLTHRTGEAADIVSRKGCCYLKG
jgi:hypothetical protein